MDKFLLSDQVGTLRAVAGTSGNIVKRIDYDSFGNIIADSNPSFTVPFGFAGGLHDRDTGLVRFGYRDYSPELGRFVAKDPIDFAGGDTNLYAYVTNDPINGIDPLGLWRSPWSIYDEATEDAFSKFPGSDMHNGPGDAYRHCLASCMMTRENGTFLTWLFGEANEKRGDWTHKQESGEKCMDRDNNATGSGFGDRTKSDADCQRSCIDAATRGNLQTYKSGSTPKYPYKR